MGLVLLLAGIKYTWGIKQNLDVYLYDESNYLQAGAALGRQGLPPAASAPLYAVWYYLLSLVEPDRVNLYYLNYVLTTILPAVFLYVLLRVNRVPIIASAVAAAYFLITKANFLTWPRPSHFALLILLASGIAARRASNARLATAALAVGALLASFARPEDFVAFLLLLALGAGLAFRRWQQGRDGRVWLPLGGVLAVAALLLAVFGLPVFSKGGSERNFMAFGQHFSAQWVGWSHLDPVVYNPWVNWREITARSFGGATTVLQALRNNPTMFAKHVFTNVPFGCTHFLGMFLHHETLLFPPGKLSEKLEAYLLPPVVLAGLYSFRVALWSRLRGNLHRCRGLLVCAGVLCVPAAASSVEIAPRDHYLLLPVAAVIVVGMALLFGRDQASPAPRPRQLLMFGSFLLVATPTLARRATPDRPTVETIHFIQSLRLTRPVTEFDAEGGYYIYQANNFRYVPESDNQGDFDRLRLEKGINLVVCTPQLQGDSHLRSDPHWLNFLQNYTVEGFEAHKVPGTEVTVFVKKDLLPAATNP